MLYNRYNALSHYYNSQTSTDNPYVSIGGPTSPLYYLAFHIYHPHSCACVDGQMGLLQQTVSINKPESWVDCKHKLKLQSI